MVSNIFITRHGFRSNWLKDVPVPDPPTGIDGDPVLAPHGLEQAQQLGVYLSTIEPRIQRIYSSPFYRCLQSIQPTAQQLNIEIYPERGVGEWYQRTRETKPQAASNEVLNGFFPEVKKDYESVLVPSPEGETIEELHERTIEAVNRLVGELQHEPSIETIVICTHAATKIALGRALTGDSSLDVRTGTCSVDKYERVSDKQGLAGEWNIVTNGDASFLEKGEEMHWSFDMAYAPGSTEDIRSREQQQQNNGQNHQQGKEEQVTVYLPLDLELAHQLDASTLRSSKMQIIDFDSKKPLFKIGDAAFEGQFEETIGTELYTDSNGQYFALSKDRVKAIPVSLKDVHGKEGTQSDRATDFQNRLKQITKERIYNSSTT